eukprot:m.120950 g.120950  ORF g.120950 m.120950 type:complete len:84 (-) comp16190_c0_seq1:31-282(-)
MSFITVVASLDDKEAVEVPLEKDDTLLLSNIKAQFPGAIGLRFPNQETGVMRAVRIAESGVLEPPEGGWGSRFYVAVIKAAGV